MRLDLRAFAVAAGIVAAALFTLCALAVAIAPTWTTNVAGTLIHLDLTGVARTITWGTFFAGLVTWSLGTAIVFGALAGLYNRLLGAPATAGVAPRATAVHG